MAGHGTECKYGDISETAQILGLVWPLLIRVDITCLEEWNLGENVSVVAPHAATFPEIDLSQFN